MEFSSDQIPQIATDILARAGERFSNEHATLITFSGDLGAGKTTMIQEIARQLGVDEELVSPTFVIYKRYPTSLVLTDELRGTSSESATSWTNLIHGDMYRLEHADDIRKLGWDELLADKGNIICIEWPERIEGAIPDWAMRVELAHGGDSEVRVFKIG